jgi:adenine-specific DNA-methyltransferase
MNSNHLPCNLHTAHEAVCKLVDQFEQYEATYLAQNYQESQLRQDFLDKFFIALGWDVTHSLQTNPFAREVTIEKRVQTGAAKRRADYSFAIAPRYKKPVFFVEAKKPSGKLDTADNYFQAIRYSWNTQLPLVLLTDFVNFHVVDARYRPNINAALSRKHKAYHYRQYRDSDTFAEIYWLFSREAVANNSIQNYVNDLPDAAEKLSSHQMGLFAGGYQSIDDLFLNQLDEYRESLARAFKRDNPSMDGEQLTETVQRTLDRLVFLRFLEDKLIEPTQIVQDIAHAKSPWKEFLAQSKRLDGIYNGVVFKPHPQMDQVGFLAQQQEFVSICEELSDVHSPYDFNHIPVEILGRIYERFLGKVVTATAKRISVEEKPEVRKAGGVFYTPDYIVQYMAEQALLPILQNKTPAQVFKTRIIDTSCGSGSFLIGVYEVLLQTVSQLYFNNPKLAKADEWVERDGKWSLTLKRKRELLVQCIYGVDIDAQAVQVAQLSLFLKLMEDETTASAALVQQEIEATLLPNLSRNIIVGNSLLSNLDDTNNQELFEGNLNLEQRIKLKAVNLRAAFNQVMTIEGGFDLMIGNPPYIKEYTHREAFDYLRTSPYYQGKMDIWYLFACRGIDLLKKDTGRLALIATNNWVTNAGAKTLRNKILHDALIEQLIDFGDYKVFKDAGIQTMILLARRASEPQQYNFDLRKLSNKKATLADAQALLLPANTEPAPAGQHRLPAQIDRKALLDKSFTFSSTDHSNVLDKIVSKRNFELNERSEVAQGIVPNPDVLSSSSFGKYTSKEVQTLGVNEGDGVFVVPIGYFGKTSKVEEKYLIPLVEPKDAVRFCVIEPPRLELIYAHKRWTDKTPLPKRFLTHLAPYKKILDLRREVLLSRIEWFNLHWPREPHFFESGERIFSVRKCAVPTFSLVDMPVTAMMSFNIIKTERINLKYLTALLNSDLVKYWLKHKGKMQGRLFQVDKEPLLAIPLHKPEGADISAIAVLVDTVLELIPMVKGAMLESQREMYQHMLDDAEQTIQNHIYRIYGLTPEDIDTLREDLKAYSQ